MGFAEIKRIWCWDDDLGLVENGLTKHQRLVLFILELHRNGRDGTDKCCPSQGRIASMTGMTPGGVAKVLKQLEKLGVIERESVLARKTGGRYTSYTLFLGRLPNHVVDPNPDIDPNPVEVTPQLRLVDSQTGLGRIDKQQRKNKSEIPIDEMWEAFRVTVLGGGRWKLNNDRKTLLRLLYTEQLKDEPQPMALFARILMAITADSHVMQKDKDFNLPESVFKNSGRRERRANAGRKLMAVSAQTSGKSGPTPLQLEAAASW